MKLHLPKQLFTALLTAITLTATPAWGGITKESQTFYINEETGEISTTPQNGYEEAKVTMLTGNSSSGMINITLNTGDSYLGFSLTDSGQTTAGNTSWFNGTQTISQNILIYDPNTEDNNQQGLVISNGNYGNTITFSGKVLGNGVLYKRHAGESNTWKFTGDVTHFTGDILLNHKDTNNSTFTIQFGKDNGSSEVRGSKDAGVAGTGAITFNNAYGKVIFNYSDSDSATPVPVYITNSINASGNGVSKVELAGNADVVFTNNVTIHELTTNASSITFSNTSHIGKATSTIDFNGGDMIVNDAATVTLNGIISNIGTVKANSNASLNLTGASISISELRGAGTVVLTSNTDSKSKFSAFVGTGFTGDIALNHSAEKTTVALTIGQDSTAKIKANSNSTIDNLSLASGATLRYNTKKYTSPTTTPAQGYTYTLKNVEIGGENTTIKLEADSEHYAGCLNITSLNNKKDENGNIVPASLTISGDAKTGYRDIVNLDGGDFDGSITYKGATNSGDTRKHALNLNHKTAFQDAVINLEAAAGNLVGLGIGSDSGSVYVKGITGSATANKSAITIYAGKQEYGVTTDFESVGESTLIIDTDGSSTNEQNVTGGMYSTGATISFGLNLQKDGVGSQTFSGDMSAFNGNIMVTGGTLKFTNRGRLSTAMATVRNGAELALGGTTEIGLLTASSSIVTLEAGAAVTLEGGAEETVSHTVGSLNANGGSLTIGDNASIEIGSVTANRTLVINKGDTESSVTIGSVTLGENFTLDSTEEISYVYISSITATTGNDTQSGYLASSGKMLLIQGYEWTGNFDGYTVSAKDGNTYLTTSTYSAVGTTYYVNGKDIVTVGGGKEATAGVEAATAFEVAAGATLNIAELPAGWTAKELLSGKVTGEGTLLISESELSTGGVDLATTFSGTLELAAGAAETSPNIFTFGATTASADNEGKTISTSSISGFVLNDNTKLQYQGSGSEFKNVTAKGSNSTFHIVDAGTGENQAVRFTGDTTVEAGAKLNLTSAFGARVVVSNLTGAGEFAAGSVGETWYTTIEGLKDFTGSLTFSDTTDHYVDVYTGTKAESVSFAKLSFAGSGKEKFYVQINTQVATLSAAGGTVDIASDKILTLGGGSSETPANHSIGTLSAETGIVSLGQYAVLTLGNGEVASTHKIGTLNAGEGAVITLNTGATLNALTKGTGTVTLKGSGVYNLGSNNTTSNVAGLTDATTWTGTVKLSGATLNGAALNTFGNTDSCISLSGVSGSLAEGTVASNILLANSDTKAALEITSGTANGEYTFTGDIKDLASGSAGNIVITTSGVDGMTFKFSGDTSGWTGGMVIAENGGSQNIVFTGNATTVNNSVIAAATNQQDKSTTLTFDHTVSATVNSQITNNYWARTGTLHLIVANTAQEGTTFTKQIEADTITVNESTKAAFEGQTKATALTVQEGATLSFATLNAQSVTNSGALNLGTAATITKAEGATAATMSKVQMSSAGISSAATDSTKGSISNALIDLQKATEFSISDMSLSNVSLKAAATGTELNLNNVTAEAVQLAAGQFTLGGEVALSEQTPATKSGGYTASFTTDQLNGITLNNASDAASLTVDLGELPDCLQDGKTYNITIALSGFSMAAYDGTGLLFAADSWLGKLLADQGASQYVSSGDVESATTLAANNNTVTVKYAAMTGENVGTIITITGLTIPEPTTSTLGLVALAALVTRRRRK